MTTPRRLPGLRGVVLSKIDISTIRLMQYKPNGGQRTSTVHTSVTGVDLGTPARTIRKERTMRSYDNHNPNVPKGQTVTTTDFPAATPIDPISAPVGDAEATEAYAAQLSAFKLAELRTAAEQVGIDPSGLRKAELVDALAGWMAAHPPKKAAPRKAGKKPAASAVTGKAAKPAKVVEQSKPASGADIHRPKGFAAQGKGHADYTKKIMAARTPAEKAAVVVELINEHDGWAATRNGDQAVLAKARDGRKITVDYPDTGHPAVRVFDSPEHGGRRQPNVSGALRWLRETQPAKPAAKKTTRSRKAAAKK